MNALLDHAGTTSAASDRAELSLRTVSSNKLEIERSVGDIIQYALEADGFEDRRAYQRVAFSQLFALTPIDNVDQMRVSGEKIHVAGKNLSPRGLGFFHHQPLPSRYAIASLPQSSDKMCDYLIKISWCRFLHPGWYDSGGKILRIVEWPE